MQASFYVTAQASRVYRFWNSPASPSLSAAYTPVAAPLLVPGATAVTDGALTIQTGYGYFGQPPLSAFSSTPFQMLPSSNGFSTGRLAFMFFAYQNLCAADAADICHPSPPPPPSVAPNSPPPPKRILFPPYPIAPAGAPSPPPKAPRRLFPPFPVAVAYAPTPAPLAQPQPSAGLRAGGRAPRPCAACGQSSARPCPTRRTWGPPYWG